MMRHRQGLNAGVLCLLALLLFVLTGLSHAVAVEPPEVAGIRQQIQQNYNRSRQLYAKIADLRREKE